MIDYILVVLLVAADITTTVLLVRKRQREAYRSGWDHAVLAQRAGLHPLLNREHSK